jgi:hypothetical protein
MIQSFFKQNQIHFLAVLLFLGIAFAYFMPSMIEGKVIRQSDVINWKGASKEVMDYRAQTGEDPLWTDAMFCGMPDYLISFTFKNNYMSTIRDTYGLGVGRPADFIFFYLIGFYIALLLFGVSPLLAIIGAFGFAFSSFFFIIIEAGHVTQALAIGFMAPIVAGVYYSITQKPIRGALVVAFFLCFQLLTQHMQITYYTIIASGVLAVLLIGQKLIEKEFKRLAISLASILVAIIIAVGLNISSLYFVNEYGKYSTRGVSELTQKDTKNKTTGLDKDYATGWSYGIAESWTLLVPNFNGGGASDDYKYSEFYKNNFEQYKNYFIEKGYSLGEADEAARGAIGGQFYWGAQPFTSGPVYAGAIICFLFVLGLFVVRGQLKWWLLIITVLSLMLAWGKNLMWFSDFWFDHIPGYNKFRTVSMTLVIAELAIPLLGMLALDRFLKGKVVPCECKPILGIKFPSIFNFTKSYAGNVIIKALALTGGILLFFALFGSSFFDFKSIQDNQETGKEIIAARQQLFTADVWRSLGFVVIAAALLIIWFTDLVWKKQQKSLALFATILGFFILFDMWSVNKRYLNSNDFVAKHEMEQPFIESTADTYILANNPEKARVLNLAVNTFNDASTSYLHQSIGGYHGAKMKRYQELVEAGIIPEIQTMIGILNNKPTQMGIDSALSKLNVLNMLNAKFIIYSPQAAPLINSQCNGTAWFIKNVKIVPNADSEIATLTQNLNTKTTIVVDKRFEKDVKIETTFDSSASIKRTSYKPNDLIYESNSKVPAIAVFSEIYYDKGWNAYIDGKPFPYFRANYVLRAMNIPAGKHTVEFKFEPKMYNMAGYITLLCFITLMGITIFYIVDQFRRKEKALE